MSENQGATLQEFLKYMTKQKAILFQAAYKIYLEETKASFENWSTHNPLVPPGDPYTYDEFLENGTIDAEFSKKFDVYFEQARKNYYEEILKKHKDDSRRI